MPFNKESYLRSLRLSGLLPSNSEDPVKSFSSRALGDMNNPNVFVSEDGKHRIDLTKRGLPKPRGFLQTGIDFLSRGNFAAAKFTDTISEEEFNVGSAWSALKAGASEFFSPKERLLFRDVINKANPVWAVNNKDAVNVLGFVGDVVIDPLNLVGPGLFKSAPKIALTAGAKAGKIVPLSKPGIRLYERLLTDFSDAGFKAGREYAAASDVISQVVERGIPEISDAPIRSLLQTTAERSTLLESNARKLISKRKVKAGGGFRIVDEDYLEEFIKTGKIPDLSKEAKQNLLNKSLGSRVQVKTSQGLIPGELTKINPKTVKVRLTTGKTITKPLGALSDTDLSRILVDRTNAFTRVVSEPLALGTMQNIAKNGREPVLMYVSKEFIERSDDLGRNILKADTPPDAIKFVDPLTGELAPVKTVAESLKTAKELRAQKVAQLKQQRSIGNQAIQDLAIKAGDELIEQSGVRILNKTIIKSDDFKRFADATGLSGTLARLRNLPDVSFLSKATRQFREHFGLSTLLESHHAEWARFRGSIEADKKNMMREAVGNYNTIFKQLTAEGRTNINNALTKAKVAAKVLIQEGKFVDEAAERKLLSEAMDTVGLSLEERAAAGRLAAMYKEIQHLETRAGLLEEVMANYNPNRYEIIGNTGLLQQYKAIGARQHNVIPKTTTFTPGEVQKFKDMAAGEKVGDLIKDSGRVFLMRFMEHKAALRRQKWEKFLVGAYGSLDNVPNAVALDLVRLGEVSYKKGFRAEPNVFLEAWDTLNNAFKRSATIVRTAFAGKQLVGNTSQLFAKFGVEGFHAFDPTIISEAFGYVTKGTVNFDLTTVYNNKIAAADLAQMLHDSAITKGVAIEGVGQLSEVRFIQQLTEDLDKVRATTNLNGSPEAIRGLRDIIRVGAKSLQVPQIVEDTFRTAGFFTALKLGNDPATATKMVDDAFFNYTSGLSEAERHIRRFAVPFYSFQKFGTVLLAKTAVTAPGRLAAIPKVTRAFSEAWNKISSGESLTDSERAALPGYLLEQPNVFEGFSPEAEAQFRTFNNLVFLDVLSFMQLDDKGDFDPRETLMKGVMAQLSPFIKIPLEVAVFNRKFFTDAALDSAYAGNIGEVNSDRLLVNLMTMAGLHFGAGGALGARILGEAGAVLGGDEILKKVISWEEGIDSRTGEKQVWVNPVLLHASMSLFPGMTEALKVSQEDRSYWDNILSMTFGINTYKFNLKDQARIRAQSKKREFQEDLFQLKTKLRQQRMPEDTFQEEAKALLDELSTTYEALTSGSIRGTL